MTVEKQIKTPVEEILPPVPAPTNSGDPTAAPLPMPEDAGIPKQQPNPYRIYVAYQAGKKIHSRLLETQFEDIDTVIQLTGVIQYLTNEHSGKTIDILFWRSLEV